MLMAQHPNIKIQKILKNLYNTSFFHFPVTLSHLLSSVYFSIKICLSSFRFPQLPPPLIQYLLKKSDLPTQSFSPPHQSTKHRVTKYSLKVQFIMALSSALNKQTLPKKENSHSMPFKNLSQDSPYLLIISSTTHPHVYIHKIPECLIHYYSNVLLQYFC